MKTALKHLLLLTSLTIALALCLTVSASAAGDWYEAPEDGTTIHHIDEPTAALMYYGEEQDPSLPQLTPPRDPRWGISYPNCYDVQEDGTQDKTQENLPGMASWSLGQLSQNEFAVYFYRVNPDENPEQGKQIGGGSWILDEENIAEGNVWTADFFLTDVQESGDYYFVVTAVGDGVNYRDSEGVKSPLWHYDDPGVRLPTPAAPVWNEQLNKRGQRVVRFDPGDSELVYEQALRFYWSPDLETEPENVGNSAYFYRPDGEVPLYSHFTTEKGAGYYYATVQYRSWDITTAQCSEESPLSEPIYISASYGKELEDIISEVNEDSTAEEIQQAVKAVQDLDTGKLAESMWTDTDNTAAAGQIKELEDLAGVTTFVNVSDDMKEVFDKNKVEMIGAGLNVDPGHDVTLNIGRPKENAVIPSMYLNSVQFSMNLTGNNGQLVTGEDGQLAVPVKLTLPIPKNINPNFLVIMHRHADGTTEELSGIDILITEEDGQSYATFMVRSFSDFVLAEQTQLTAVKDPGGVSVTVNADPGGRSLTAALAVYDSNGKQLGVSLADLTGGEQTKLVSCDPNKADHVRVMILDNWKPAETARTVNVT